MNAIETFIKKIFDARDNWVKCGGSPVDWMRFYDKKDAAWQEFMEKEPLAAALTDRIWGILAKSREMATLTLEAWLTCVESGVPCLDCGTNIKFPAKRCEECADNYEQLIKERREVAKKLQRKR